MYVVNSNYQYIQHFCSSHDIATAVLKDLSTRECCKYPDMIDIVKQEGKAYWDPGGSLWKNDMTHTFVLGAFEVNIFYQHINVLANFLNKATIRECDGIKYYKVHSGYLNCLCISLEEYKSLCEMITDPNINTMAKDSEEKRLDVLRQSGIIL